LTHLVDIAADLPLTAGNGAGHSPCGSRWAVCQTHPQAERWALANLTRQGYQAYLPLITVLRRDRVTPTLTRPVQVPLFSGYVFVVPTDPWAPIAHTLGVSKLLMAGNHPHYLPAGLTEALQASLAQAATRTQETAAWAPGVPVVVSGGAAFGLRGVIVQAKRDRAAVVLMMFGDLRQVDIGLGNLSRATDEV
jgi:transcription antitermination factor NusG